MRVRRLLLVALGLGLVACSPSVTPTAVLSPLGSPVPPQASEFAAPTATRELSIACGPLGSGSCDQAVTVALSALSGACRPAGLCGPALAVMIASPSAERTCPPSGGPGPGLHICEVIAVVTTTKGDVLVGLEPTDGGWIWSEEIR